MMMGNTQLSSNDGCGAGAPPAGIRQPPPPPPPTLLTVNQLRRIRGTGGGAGALPHIVCCHCEGVFDICCQNPQNYPGTVLCVRPQRVDMHPYDTVTDRPYAQTYGW